MSREVPHPCYDHLSRAALRRLAEARRRHVSARALDDLEALREAGQPWRAERELRRIVADLSRREEADDLDRWLWTRAHSQLLRCMADRRSVEGASQTLRGFVNQLGREGWRAWQKDVSEQYARLIAMQVSLDHFTEALDVYAECGDILVLDGDTLYRLARAAAAEERDDEGAVGLYLDYFETPERLGDANREAVAQALRRALHVTHDRPEEERLPRRIKANERAHAADPLFSWTQGNIAMAWVRQGRVEKALKAARACAPLDEADGETLTQLGVVYCFAESWAEAGALFARARSVAGDSPVVAYYAALALAHEALLTPEAAEDTATLAERLKARAKELRERMLSGPEALDGAWVSLCLAVATDDKAFLESPFHPPEGVVPKWRQAVAWAEAAHLRREAKFLAAWRDGRPAADRRQLWLGSAMVALERLWEGAADAAREAVETAARLAEDEKVADREPDARAAAFWLRYELALLEGSATPEPPEGAPTDAAAVPKGTPAVVAQAHRALAWQALRCGDFDVALEHAADRAHSVGAWWRVEPLRAIAYAYAGRAPEADRRIERLLERASQVPAHRTLAGLWRLSRERHEDAWRDLQPLVGGDAPAFDACLAAGEASLRLGETERARDLLRRAVDGETSDRPLLFRPWRLQTPKEKWALAPEVGRAADLCHLGELLAEVGEAEKADEALRRVEALPEAAVSAVGAWLARALSNTALRFVERGDLDRACETQRRAEGFGEVGADFVERLAQTVQGGWEAAEGEPELSDPILERFLGHAKSFAERPADFAASLPGVLVARGLHVDASTPAAAVEFERRRRWCERLAELLGDWDWPHRNLARAHLRADEPEPCVARVERIAPEAWTDEDLRLKGEALYRLGRYAEAAKTFDAAFGKGGAVLESRVRRGVCRAADAWTSRVGEALEAEPLLADLALTEDEVAAAAPETRELAVVWRAAVLLFADRPREARGVLEGFTPASEAPSLVLALRGLADLRLGMIEPALSAWENALGSLPEHDDLVVLALWARLGRPGYRNLAADADLGLRLQRAGRQDAAALLLRARVAFRRGRRAEATTALEAARKAEPTWKRLPLALLNQQVERERLFLEARARLAAGAFAEGAEFFSRLQESWFSAARAAFYRGLAMAHAGRSDEAAQVLKPLAEKGDCDAAAVLARLGGEPSAAARWVEVALDIEAEHPLALLVAAEASEQSGDAAAAAERRRQVADDAERAPAELRVAARLGLGRLAEDAGDWAAAEGEYAEALELAPGDATGVNRLVCLLARAGLDGDKAGAALERLAALPAAQASFGALFASAVLAERMNRPDRLAEALAALVARPENEALEPAQRSALARWSVHAQLRETRYAEAAEAIRALLEMEDAPDLRRMLVECRMLQSLTLLHGEAVNAETLAQVGKALEEVLALREDHPVALVLSATVRVLGGAAGDDVFRERVARVDPETLQSDDLRTLHAVNCVFAGEDVAGLDARLTEADLPAEEKAYLRVLAAARGAEAARLASLAPEALEGALESGWPLPTSVSDLALFLARGRLAEGDLKGTVEALERLREKGEASEDAHRLLALALARQSLGMIEKQMYADARQKLDEARAALKAPIGAGVD